MEKARKFVLKSKENQQSDIAMACWNFNKFILSQKAALKISSSEELGPQKMLIILWMCTPIISTQVVNISQFLQ